MSRKKKPRSKQAKARSPEQLARAATDHLERGRFKDAVAEYKQLLKNDQRPEWAAGLARAYAGRAEHLASRGMVKEAIAVWQNRAAICNEPVADPRYLQWLVAAGRSGEIARLYHQNAAALAGADGVAALQSRLAAAALADGGKLIDQLSAGDPVARDFAAANSALTAYAERDDETFQAALSQIAFRSPYRDLRQLLKALVRREQDPAAAAQLSARVATDTPFAGILRALGEAGKIDAGEPVDAAAVAALPGGVQDLLAVLVGWSRNQRQLLVPVARLNTNTASHALFDFVLAHRKVLGNDYARIAAFMLAGDDPRLHRRIRKVYHALPESEALRLLALSYEMEGQTVEATELWQRMLDSLDMEAAQGTDEQLRRALIHRHIVELIQPRSASLPLEFEVVEHLTASLEFDARDRANTLRLVDHYLHVGDLKSARHWVDRALAQFADDPDCLFKAAETAVAGQAFKKAVRFGERILAIDPINANARGLLVDSHLGHARKQIKARKPDAARREIGHAADYARNAIDTARVALLAGLTTFACDGNKAAAPALKAAVEGADDALVGRFLLLLEAYRAGQNLASVTRAARLPAIKTLGERAHVLALVDTIGTLRGGQLHKPAVEAALQKLAPAFKAAAGLHPERGRCEQICEILLRYGQYTTLKIHARAALKRWPGEPLFTFYWVMGDAAGGYLAPFGPKREHLETAFEAARAAGDNRAAQRIGAKLDEMLPRLPRFAPDAFDPFDPFDPFDDDLEPDWPADSDDGGFDIDAARQLLEFLLPPDDFERLEKAMERGEPVPPDVANTLRDILGDGCDAPLPKKQAPRTKNRRPRQNDAQGDLFGDI